MTTDDKKKVLSLGAARPKLELKKPVAAPRRHRNGAAKLFALAGPKPSSSKPRNPSSAAKPKRQNQPRPAAAKP